MGKGIMEWVIGPQAVGLVMLIVGYIQKCYPPKKINKYYGYRLPSATKNQKTWDEANQYSAKVMIKTGIFLLLAGLLLTLLIKITPMPENIKWALSLFIIIAAAMGSAIAMIVSTEHHLTKTFDSKQ